MAMLNNQRVIHLILEHMVVCQNLVPLVNPKIAGIYGCSSTKNVSIGIDPYPLHLILEHMRKLMIHIVILCNLIELKTKLAGGSTYPSETYESQLGRIIPYTMDKNKCLNHQPG